MERLPAIWMCSGLRKVNETLSAGAPRSRTKAEAVSEFTSSSGIDLMASMMEETARSRVLVEDGSSCTSVRRVVSLRSVLEERSIGSASPAVFPGGGGQS